MKILIVEDERKTGEYLRQGLSEAGFVTDLARDGIDGAHLANQNDYDLVVLDVMLPGIDGWEVLQRIRAAGRTMPVLFLTARDQVNDRVKGLELGADDYLVKPFDVAELDARIQAVLRRSDRDAPQEVVVGALRLTADEAQLFGPAGAIALTPRELHVLRRLMRNAGRVVTKAQLTETLAALNEDIGDKTVEVYVHRIRNKIHGHGVEIVTVRGFGYLLRVAG